MLEPPDTLRRRLFRECDRQDWRGVVALSATVKGMLMGRAIRIQRWELPRMRALVEGTSMMSA